MATGRTPPSAAELERRRLQAERRQRYRGERRRPYEPRGIRNLRGQYVQLIVMISPRQKRAVRAAAKRSGMSMAAWIREVVDDTLEIEARRRRSL